MSKIKLSNDIRIDISSLAIAIDVNNVLSDQNNWTATEDCFCVFYSGGSSFPMHVDNVRINNHCCCYAKQGAVVTYEGSPSPKVKCFGLK